MVQDSHLLCFLGLVNYCFTDFNIVFFFGEKSAKMLQYEQKHRQVNNCVDFPLPVFFCSKLFLKPREAICSLTCMCDRKHNYT